ncbi:MAG: hypothetical protein LAP39_13350 [Acidobacteriia bacterium]|nr:hypothetical protein [Terriglobia bacterium]
MKLAKALTALWILAIPCAAQQVINGSRTLLGNWDASGAATTKPAKTGTVLPATCGVGEVFFNSSASPGGNLYLCAAANAWTQVQGTSGGGGSSNFRQAFTNVTSATLVHNLNTFGIVFSCFDNSTPPLWILPKSVSLTDANTLTVTFASSQSGSCVVNATGGGTYTPGAGISVAGSTLSVDKTSVPTYLAASTSLSFGAIAQASCAQLTLALTGANPGDSIAPGWPSTIEAGLAGSMFVSASNTIAVRLCNLSGSTLTPAAQTFRATVIRSFP